MKLWIENIILPAIIYQENSPGESFEDCSNNMQSWDIALNIMDWSRRRDKIAALFYAITGDNLANYGNLTADQKLIGAKYFLVPYSLRVTNGIVTEEQDFIDGEFLLSQTKVSRVNCVEAMRRSVWNGYVRKGLLTMAQSQSLFLDLGYSKIVDFQEANIYDLKQWIFGLAPYEGVFAAKDYFTTGLQNELIDIYNGNY